MHSNAKGPTKSERHRMNRINELGCLLFHRIGQYRPAEVHHLLDGGVRRGHRFTIGLSAWHHRGVVDPGADVATMTICFGPSLAYGSRLFHAFHGGDDRLLAEQDRRIDEADALER